MNGEKHGNAPRNASDAPRSDENGQTYINTNEEDSTSYSGLESLVRKSTTEFHPIHEYESDGVAVLSELELTNAEILKYVKLGRDKLHGNLRAIEIAEDPDPDFVKINYLPLRVIPFERIRRITGYLVGTLDRWNDAKRAEESDRVKHQV